MSQRPPRLPLPHPLPPAARRTQAPITQAVPNRIYTFCVWARTAPGAVTNVTRQIIAVSGNNWLFGTPPLGAASGGGNSPWVMLVTPSWQKFCLRELLVNTPMNVQFQMFLMGTATTMHFDDATLTYEQLDADYMLPAKVESRIDALRKGNFTLRFVDQNGALMPAGSIQSADLTYRRHDFPFGSAYEPWKVRVCVCVCVQECVCVGR